MPELIEHYLVHYAKRYGREVPELSAAARTALLHHDWPGNVRALRHALERAVILARDVPLEPADFALISASPRIAPQAVVAPRAAEDLNLERVERRLWGGAPPGRLPLPGHSHGTGCDTLVNRSGAHASQLPSNRS